MTGISRRKFLKFSALATAAAALPFATTLADTVAPRALMGYFPDSGPLDAGRYTFSVFLRGTGRTILKAGTETMDISHLLSETEFQTFSITTDTLHDTKDCGLLFENGFSHVEGCRWQLERGHEPISYIPSAEPARSNLLRNSHRSPQLPS